MARKKLSESFKVGDRVQIRHSEWRGRIVEERGPLAPGRVLVFRVRIPDKPKPKYIEVREDQLIAIPTPPGRCSWAWNSSWQGMSSGRSRWSQR
jgi:hypothetical protein